ncbi:MAG: methionyl-tRNA formyltransferase [bacterium]
MTKQKIIFIGASQFAVPSLKNLIKNNYDILAVITAPDKPVGRKQELFSCPVKQTALKHKLSILQPIKISEVSDKIAKLKPDLIIVASYGQIIPKNILDIPCFGSINIHPSLLPKYRGPSPIQTAILNNEKTTGITIMLMDEKMDHGPIISQETTLIDTDDNYQTLEKKLSEQSADFLIKTLPQYIQNKIKPQIQNENNATYTKILTREHGKINWNQTAQQIERMIRAFFPWPGAWTELNGKRIKILKAKAVDKKQKSALPAKKGFLLCEIVQPAGKKPMTGEEFFRGIH